MLDSEMKTIYIIGELTLNDSQIACQYDFFINFIDQLTNIRSLINYFTQLLIRSWHEQHLQCHLYLKVGDMYVE